MSYTHVPAQSFTHPLIHLLIYLFTYLFVHLFIYILPTYSFVHPFTYLPPFQHNKRNNVQNKLSFITSANDDEKMIEY
jgi:hypothetical protein